MPGEGVGVDGDAELNVVTGAFSYTGKYIAQRLISAGKTVATLTNHPERPNPFGERVRALPFNFDNRSQLLENLRGATTLYNTYWIRFPRGATTFDSAVKNTELPRAVILRGLELRVTPALTRVSISFSIRVPLAVPSVTQISTPWPRLPSSAAKNMRLPATVG